MEPSNETKICPYCDETILADAIKCRYCKEMLDDNIPTSTSKPGYERYMENAKETKWSRRTAGILSFLIPGVGQIYKRQVGLGILWLIFVSVAYKPFLIVGVLVHIGCIYDAVVSKAD